jgi:hypothetical protein
MYIFFIQEYILEVQATTYFFSSPFSRVHHTHCDEVQKAAHHSHSKALIFATASELVAQFP